MQKIYKGSKSDEQEICLPFREGNSAMRDLLAAKAHLAEMTNIG